MAHVNEGLHSFTCHPHLHPQMEWATLAFTHISRASSHFGSHSLPIPLRVGAWVGLGGWLHTELVCPSKNGPINRQERTITVWSQNGEINVSSCYNVYHWHAKESEPYQLKLLQRSSLSGSWLVTCWQEHVFITASMTQTWTFHHHTSSPSVSVVNATTIINVLTSTIVSLGILSKHTGELAASSGLAWSKD